MKAVMVMFDSLNRHMLPPYGCDWVHAPNFQRLAKRTATFENSFVGSMPCMPARRDLHTGRYNFLHCPWGPLEPYDESMPEILKSNGVYTHLVTDHYHYFEEGGSNYVTRYSSWQFARGQEGDPWNPTIKDPTNIPRPNLARGEGDWSRGDWVNRSQMQEESSQPQAKTFAMGLKFLEENHDEDNWFLQIETFDPHEPYFSSQNYKDLYDFDYDKVGDEDWPPYGGVPEKQRAWSKHYQHQNAALISMCDHYLGQVLDAMDQHGLWQDTLLIVCTDHGFLLGEHDHWGKCSMPFWNEIANTPLFIWDPRCGVQAERRQALVQMIDFAPTLLEYFGQEIPETMQGRPLRDAIAEDKPVREAALFGMFGAHVNVTDGRYVYMRAGATEENTPLNEYTYGLSHMRKTYAPEELQETTLSEPFSFTKGCPIPRICRDKGGQLFGSGPNKYGTLLFDNESDYAQEQPLADVALESRMIELLIREMKAGDAPVEQYERLGLED